MSERQLEGRLSEVEAVLASLEDSMQAQGVQGPEGIRIRPDGGIEEEGERGGLGVIGVLAAISPPTIATGGKPFGVCVSPNGASVYVTNEKDNSISVYERNENTGLLTPTATVATGSEPRGLTCSPDGQYLYVCCTKEKRLRIYARDEKGELTEIGTIAAGSSPVAVIVSPDGKYVYVACRNEETSVFQFSRNTITGELAPLEPDHVGVTAESEQARNIIISPDGLNVYLTCQGGKSIIEQYKRDPETGLLTSIGPVAGAGAKFDGIAISADGKNVYTTCLEGGEKELLQFGRNLTSGLLTALIPGNVAYRAGGFESHIIVSINDHNVYAVNGQFSNIQQYSRSIGTGPLAPLTPPTEATGTRPLDIAASSDGLSIYVTNWEANTLSIYALD